MDIEFIEPIDQGMLGRFRGGGFLGLRTEKSGEKGLPGFVPA